MSRDIKIPPLGLRPRWVVAEERRREIFEAITRYALAGIVIPAEWNEELKEICAYLETRKNKTTQCTKK